MTTLAKIDQLEDLLSSITNGDWNEFTDAESSDVITSAGDHVACDCASPDDALFISMARNAMPHLLAAARALNAIKQDWVAAAKAGSHIPPHTSQFQEGLRALESLR